MPWAFVLRKVPSYSFFVASSDWNEFTVIQKYHKRSNVTHVISEEVKTKLHHFSLGEAACRWGKSELESKNDLDLISETPWITLV